MKPAQIARAFRKLMAWPLRMAGVRSLLEDAWGHRANITVSDALYVALAAHLRASLLTDDRRLVRTPQLPVATLHLP